PMPNSEVKRRSADGSVGSPHARVGNCQASNKAEGHPKGWPFCVSAKKQLNGASLNSVGPVSAAPPGDTARTTSP
ncbi:hypothetical protein N8L13_21160, partial [Pseudocitrobacter sp. MW920760]|nr:hypothetical protein [Pseudocitrobacter sp. MW920760]